MQKQSVAKKKEEVIGSETILERIKRKTPWIPGKLLRKPKINFPKFRTPRVSLPMPSKYLSIVLVYIILFILQTGVIYLMIRNTPALGSEPGTGDPMFLYPDLYESFIIEGIVASMLIFFCSIGFIFLYQASKHFYNKSLALRMLAIGILMIIITFIILQYMIGVKMGTLDEP
ncbi:MAG: hypothetical protein ACFFAQ_01550 [Promethearchaeota archaeon]